MTPKLQVLVVDDQLPESDPSNSRIRLSTAKSLSLTTEFQDSAVDGKIPEFDLKNSRIPLSTAKSLILPLPPPSELQDPAVDGQIPEVDPELQDSTVDC